MGKKIKVHIPAVTIELDSEDWTTTFGVEGIAAIRADVRDYILHALPYTGAFGNGEVEATFATKDGVFSSKENES